MRGGTTVHSTSHFIYRIIYILLCVRIDLNPRFKLDRQFLIVDRNLLDQPPDQGFGVFRYFRCLFIKEGDRLTHRQTVDLHSLLFHLIPR